MEFATTFARFKISRDENQEASRSCKQNLNDNRLAKIAINGKPNISRPPGRNVAAKVGHQRYRKINITGALDKIQDKIQWFFFKKKGETLVKRLRHNATLCGMEFLTKTFATSAISCRKVGRQNQQTWRDRANGIDDN